MKPPRCGAAFLLYHVPVLVHVDYDVLHDPLSEFFFVDLLSAVCVVVNLGLIFHAKEILAAENIICVQRSSLLCARRSRQLHVTVKIRLYLHPQM